MPTDDQSGASSAPAAVAESPVEQAVVSGDQAAFRDARRAERSGKAPLSSPAASTPAEPAAQVASTDASASPASEPGKPSRSNAETRIRELLAERHQLAERNAALERQLNAPRAASPSTDAPPAASSPAVGEDFPEFEAWFEKHGNPNSTDAWKDYIRALTKHTYAEERAAETVKQAQERQQQDEATQIGSYRDRAEQFKAQRPDYWDVVNPIALVAKTPTNDAMGQVIRESEIAPQLLYHLGTHLEDYHRITALPPVQAVYALGRLEASLASPSTVRAERPITSAPKPPTTLGSRAADPGDDLSAAVASGDVARFKELRQRQRAAQFSR